MRPPQRPIEQMIDEMTMAEKLGQMTQVSDESITPADVADLSIGSVLSRIGGPLVIPDLVARSDAVIAAWLPGTEAAVLGELLAGLYRFEGRTPQPWPRSLDDSDSYGASPLYEAGHGIRDR